MPSGSDGIRIVTSNVTLDLNGFSITTPVQAVGASRRKWLGAARFVLSWDLPGGSSSFALDSYSHIEQVNAPDFGLGVTFPSIIAFSTARSVGCIASYNSSQPSFDCTFTGNNTIYE